MNTLPKKALSVQDISCYGQCSNTVVFPLLTAAGLETVMLPTALLSTHTGGFSGFTFLDLTEEMEKILRHFTDLGLRFDYMTTGYFGSGAQIDLVRRLAFPLLREGALRVIDPVLGDGGRLYSIYDAAYVLKMRELCEGTDYITPNLTEACLLADLPYPGDDGTDADFFSALFGRLHGLGVKNVMVTGIRFTPDTIGVVCSDGEKTFRAAAPYVDRHIHGTGDTLTGAFGGFLSRGLSFCEAATRAVRFVFDCITDTLPNIDEHWYGISFENRLGDLAV